MFHKLYEELVQFGSQSNLESELTKARRDYIHRTGDLFESDETYERRIAAFLEWYVFDRSLSDGNKTPAKLFVEFKSPGLTTSEVTRLRALTRTYLSLFEFRKFKANHMEVVDLLTETRHEVFERRLPIGLAAGDIVEARLINFDEVSHFTDTTTCHPREGRKAILKAVKRYRTSFKVDADGQARLDLVHRAAFFANKADRYKHLNPKDIFCNL